MEVPADKNKYLIYDGNLRITAIKILTTYKEDLDKLSFTIKQQEKLRDLKYDGDLINCAVCQDIEIVRREVIKLHNANIGIGPRRWDSKSIAQRQQEYLEMLKQPYEEKVYTIGMHPLAPQIRAEWNLKKISHTNT